MAHAYVNKSWPQFGSIQVGECFRTRGGIEVVVTEIQRDLNGGGTYFVRCNDKNTGLASTPVWGDGPYSGKRTAAAEYVHPDDFVARISPSSSEPEQLDLFDL